MPIGLIAGSGISRFEGLRIEKTVSVPTPYGEPSSPYTIGTLGNKVVVFLQRHGPNHTIPPHKINYRANIWGFKTLGIDRIISIGSVGGISEYMEPGAIVLLDQIIDFTFGTRASTFYDGNPVVHVDFTDPYCQELRMSFVKASESVPVPIFMRGTYICTQGPRLETAREIRFFNSIGADVVGMTAMPEAILCRELEMCMAGIGVVANRAAGITGDRLSAEEIASVMATVGEKLKYLVQETILLVPHQPSCSCREALRGASLTLQSHS